MSRSPQKHRILIVDDEESITRLLKLHLEGTGRYEVRTENRGAEALAAARAFRPHLMLLDVVMPDISGGTLASQIQMDSELCDIPIVFLTAVVSKEEVRERGGVVGGRPFLAKPVSMDEVFATIAQQLPGRK